MYRRKHTEKASRQHSRSRDIVSRSSVMTMRGRRMTVRYHMETGDRNISRNRTWRISPEILMVLLAISCPESRKTGKGLRL